MSIQGQQIDVNGLTPNVYVEGEREPVMLLHGFPDSNYLWRGVVPNLVDNGYRVIAPTSEDSRMTLQKTPRPWDQKEEPCISNSLQRQLLPLYLS